VHFEHLEPSQYFEQLMHSLLFGFFAQIEAHLEHLEPSQYFKQLVHSLLFGFFAQIEVHFEHLEPSQYFEQLMHSLLFGFFAQIEAHFEQSFTSVLLEAPAAVIDMTKKTSVKIHIVFNIFLVIIFPP
jgi:hypothetical protein